MNRTLFTLVLFSSFATAWAGDAPRVIVAPFADRTPGATHEWVGRALDRSLLADLSRAEGFTTTAAPAELKITYDAKDPSDALDAGAAAGAAYVVVGAYEVVDNEIRVTGATLDVATGDSAIGAIGATGQLRNVVALQDAVAAQVEAALTSPRPRNQVAASPTTRPTAAAASAPPTTQRTTTFNGSDLERSVSDESLPIGPAPLLTGSRVTLGDDVDLVAVLVGVAVHNRGGVTPAPSPTDLTLASAPQPTVPQPRAAATAAPGNGIGGGPGNSVGPTAGNTMGGTQGLNVVNTPGNVMTGGSGNIFLHGPGNFINGGAGNQIIDPYGHTMGVVWGHEINNPTPRVMQGGDGNFITGGAGITIQTGARNTAGGISGNTVQSSPGNSARSATGNTNR